jgi:hypothetical protein
MMGEMSMSMSMSMGLRQSQLQVTGGLSQTVFPRIDQLLISDSENQKAIKWVARNKDMNRYRSIVDFILCEMQPRFRPSCFRFYKDKGPPLRDMLDADVLFVIEDDLIRGLKTARCWMEEARKASWKQLREETGRSGGVANGSG